MAAKRTASSELTHENWDVDDEREDAGSFQMASDDVIKNRVIKRAVRRNPISSVRNVEDEGEKSNVFGNFTFKKSPASSSFDFLKSVKSTETTKTNGLSESPIMKNSLHEHKKVNDKGKEYYAKLKGLNESVSKWIKKHVDDNPFISLTPVFKDYEKYLSELEEEREKGSGSNKTEHTMVFQKATDKDSDTNKIAFTSPIKMPVTNFQSTAEKGALGSISKAKESATMAPNKFTMPVTSTPVVNFKFGANAQTSGGFTFGGSTSTPCTFQNVAASSVVAENDKDGEDDEDQPPKVEVKEVEEEGHSFKMRCKVFVKKEASFNEGTVGNLFLKPVPDSEKVQLIVRADTNLGNLLCNFILSESIPVQKKGKKDVLLVCLPTPDFTSPVPLLLRVKTPEEAETLYQELEKNKR